MAGKDDLLRRVDELEEENGRLKRKLALLGAGTRESMFSVPRRLQAFPKSIAGIEGMYLQVDGSRTVVNLNSGMVRLIGRPKEDCLGRPVDEIDTMPWAPGLFITLLGESSSIGAEVELETLFPDPVAGRERTLLFRASWNGDVGTVAVLDRTEYVRILSTFRKYVSPVVIEKMQDRTEDFFRTDRAVVTILFADLRGFTPMSAALEPGEVERSLNQYLAASIGAIDRYEGTVDKILGDGVMGLFGAPILCEDHPLRAIKAAIDMQIAHRETMARWESRGIDAPPLGIGIDTGEVIVGNIGCDARTSYTALGHHVNLASRICGVAKGGEILASKGTVEALSAFSKARPAEMREKVDFQKAGELALKGIPEPVPVARVLY